MARVICRSGCRGSRYRLRKNYVDFAEFRAYAEVYGLHRRLGFATPRAAWAADPLVESSTYPGDYRKVGKGATRE